MDWHRLLYVALFKTALSADIDFVALAGSIQNIALLSRVITLEVVCCLNSTHIFSAVQCIRLQSAHE